MPTFPPYRDELPHCLNPLNPCHYILLAYWLYFRPTDLRCYLYQADSDLYRSSDFKFSSLLPSRSMIEEYFLPSSADCVGFSPLQSTTGKGVLDVPAYRNLYLLIPGVSAFLTVLVGLPIVLLTSLITNLNQTVHVNLLDDLDQIAYVNLLDDMPNMVLRMVAGVAVGVIFGLVFGLGLVLLRGYSLNVSYGVVRSVAFGVTFGVAFGAAFGIVSEPASSMLAFFGLANGVAFGVVFFFANGVVLGLASGVVLALASGVVLLALAGGGVVASGGGGVSSLAILALALVVGALRIPFYLLQLGLMWLKPAFEWDELVVLTLPGTQRLLTQRLQKNQLQGVKCLADLVTNPFQRWVVQRTLQIYLHHRTKPLHFLYSLLANPALETYIFTPLTEQDWQKLPSIRQVFLGELHGKWVDCAAKPIGQLSELLVWQLTKFKRDRRKTPLTRFAGVLYKLLDKRRIDTENFDLSNYKRIFTAVTCYSGGTEIEQSFTAIARFLACTEIAALPAAVRNTESLTIDDIAIRPAVLAALNRLRDIGAEIETSLAATSRVNRLAAIARAITALDQLKKDVEAETIAPERTLLQRIIRQWRSLAIEEGGKAVQLVWSEPVANPYVAGNPVTGDLFVGREDILRRLRELWIDSEQPASVLLYGHRRMGKSSILRNLRFQMGANVAVVDFNMQLFSHIRSTGELLHSLALAIYDRLPVESQHSLGEPEQEKFTHGNPYHALNRFLSQVDLIRAERRFIIAIDEFELIEQRIEENRLEQDLIGFLRGLIQTYPWLVMVFAGLHTLQEMAQDFWNPFFASVTTIPVSFLSPQAVKQLIVQPSADFDLNYAPDAVDWIVELTGCQPYLIQLIGRTLVTRFNRQTFEEGIERDRRFTVADVEAVINTLEFYRDGNNYFNGVWVQAENSEPAGQTALLEALVGGRLSLNELVEATGLSLEQVDAALETLQNHDVIALCNDGYGYTVELMRRWVARRMQA